MRRYVMVKRNNVKTKTPIVGLIKVSHAVSLDKVSVFENANTSRSHPNKEGDGSMYVSYTCSPSTLECLHEYRPNNSNYLTRKQFQLYIDTLFSWTNHVNSSATAKGRFTPGVVEVAIASRDSLDERTLKINPVGTVSCFPNPDELNEVLDLWENHCERYGVNRVIVNLKQTFYHNGGGNPNGDPDNINSPRINDTGRLWMSSVCIKNHMRDVWREKYGVGSVYVIPRVSVVMIEKLLDKELGDKVADYQNLTNSRIDVLYYGALRAVKD
jgi:hypothetical protein